MVVANDNRTAGFRVVGKGPATRIEVITEGLLTRRLQADPELPGVGLVIFDEFHERGLDSDLALGMALNVGDPLGNWSQSFAAAVSIPHALPPTRASGP